MKIHLLLIPALILCINASAQNAGGRISGIVVDEAEDTPLTGASIVVKELQKGQVADIDGKFSFTNLPEATYTVLVDLIGYDQQEKTVRVEKGRTTSLLICLKEQPLSLEQATVTAKSEARKVREQAMPVSVISMGERLTSAYSTSLTDSPNQSASAMSILATPPDMVRERCISGSAFFICRGPAPGWRGPILPWKRSLPARAGTRGTSPYR